MKTIIVLGSGNSGASAIRTCLCQEKTSKSVGIKFRIVNDPDGINDLYFNLYKNFSINNAANAVNNFFLFINNSYNSRLNKKKNL